MIGRTISHYNITAKLGEGGMGIVYKAFDTRLERDVAIKFLTSHLAASEDNRNRFVREARAASALNHPNVCTIHSIEETDLGGKFPGQFIVMEFVSGTTLRKKNHEGPHKISEALLYAEQIIKALKEAHYKGIAHLDIKSDNIMINSMNQVKVMDFGLAKLRNKSYEAHYDQTLGTAAYMSPEQALGEVAGYPSDVWSIGVVIYEMLTGKLPFIDEYEEAIVYSIINEDPVNPRVYRSDIPSELEEIILKCLQKEKSERYTDAGELLADIQKLIKQLNSSETGKETIRQQKKETEQKHATIVYMKLHNHQGLLNELGNEEYVNLLENLYDIISRITIKYSGTVDQIEAVEIVLYFGLPETIENSARNALYAVNEILDALTALTTKINRKAELYLHTGINTGMVIAGSISSGTKFEYTVIGETADIACELMNMADKGEILAGPLTYRSAGNNFNFNQNKSLTLKGKRDPVTIYKIQPGKSSSAKSFLSSEMVGRNDELKLLNDLIEKALKCEGSAVSIIAEAGIGKTRLLGEFKKHFAEKDILVLEGKALSTFTNSSFYPIIEILQQWAGITEADNDDDAIAKLKAAIHRFSSVEEDEIVPFVATLMGLHLKGDYNARVNEVSGDSLDKLIQKSMRMLIVNGAKNSPVVFIVEDLHWADHSSIELILSLLRLAEHNRILFISTLRPNYSDAGRLFLSSVRSKYNLFHTEINLEPLQAKDCESLLSNLLKSELPTQLKNSIISISEGNPYFIEEIIRSLIDDEIIKIDDGKFILSGSIEGIFIPGNIRDVLLSRIDKLDEVSKHVIKTAAVIGRYFAYDLLAATASEYGSPTPVIKKLLSLELIKEADTKADIQFLFKHALVQEAVYETMLSKTRQELHIKTAASMERLYADKLEDFYETLAYHYNLGNDKDKAEEYLIKAGEKTLKSAASYEALNYFRDALKIYLEKYGAGADKEKVFQLEKNIGMAFYQKGYFKEAVEHFNRALEIQGIKTERKKGAEILRFVYNFLSVIRRLYLPYSPKEIISERENEIFEIMFKNVIAYANHDARKMFAELLNLVRTKMGYNLNGIDGFTTYSIASSLFSYSGLSFSISKKFIDKANQHSHSKGTSGLFSNGYDETIYKCLQGDWGSFKKINEDLLELKLKSGDLLYPVYQICWSLYIIIGRGEYEYANYLLSKGEEIAEMYDYEYGKLYLLSMKADLCLNMKKLDEAIKYYTDSCELAEKLSLGSWLLGLSGKRAKAYTLLNNLPAAEESLRIAEHAKNQAKDLTPLLLAHYTAYGLFYYVKLFEKQLREKSPVAGETERKIKKFISESLKLEKKVAEIKPEVQRFIGIYYRVKGEYNKAVTHLLKSIEYAKYLEARPELGRSYMELGKFLTENKNISSPINVSKAFEEAQMIFESLGLKHDLNELYEITNPSSNVNNYNYSMI